MKRVIAIIMLLLLIFLTSCHEEVKTENINDKNLFISGDYAKEVEENGESICWKRDAGVHAKEFFPQYNKIEYKFSNVDFFVRCRYYESKGDLLDAAFVLELSFDKAEKYEEAKEDIYSSYSFLEKRVRDDDGIGFVMPATKFEIGSFLLKIITNGEGKDNYPNHIYAMGFSDTKSIIRYVYLYDSNDNEVEEFSISSYVRSLCNKEW